MREMQPGQATRLKIQGIQVKINSIQNHSSLNAVFGAEAKRMLNALKTRVAAEERTLRLAPSVLQNMQNVLEQHHTLAANPEITNQEIIELKRKVDFIKQQLSELGV